jgi:hypothetical protein
LREKGKTKEDKGKEAKKNTLSGCKCSLDRNTKKRRKADKRKEKKRKGTHSGMQMLIKKERGQRKGREEERNTLFGCKC